MIHIDGTHGEGGGQILRSSLALSMITGKPFRISNIRAKREKPGLLRQHLTAVNAAAAVCGATVDGAMLGSRELVFTPGDIKPGEYTFAIGTAGSTTLVLQTVLPALLTASGPSSITLEGGTHNPLAPPVDFIERTWVPLINRMGPTVHVAMERAGFYPAGGGRWFVNVEPTSELQPLHLGERGELLRKSATGIVAGLPGDIAKRELERVARLMDFTDDQLHLRQWPAEWGPGNALIIELVSEHVTEVITSFGQKSVTAAAVAERAVREARRYLAAGAAVGEHLADQLLLPLSLAGGGSFLTGKPTQHTLTHAEVIRQFLDVRIAIEASSELTYRIRVDSSRPG